VKIEGPKKAGKSVSRDKRDTEYLLDEYFKTRINSTKEDNKHNEVKRSDVQVKALSQADIKHKKPIGELNKKGRKRTDKDLNLKKDVKRKRNINNQIT